MVHQSPGAVKTTRPGVGCEGGPQDPVNQWTMFRLRELDRLMHSSVGRSVEDKKLIEPEPKNVAKIEIDPGGSE